MQKHSLFILSATFASLLLTSGIALAVAPPSSTEPSRAPQQIAPLAEPSKPEGATVTSKSTLQAPSGASKVKFKLVSVEITGMTAYKDSDIKSLYKGMIGETISLADVYDLANRITAKYRNDGYILTQVVVPPQTIEGGHIRFRVVEGVVNNIRIEGETHGRLSDLQPFVDKIKETQPFNSKVLERYLLLINDLPGITAKAVLSPAKVPGATDITIVTSWKPYDLFFQVDNRGSRYLGPLQTDAGIRLNNMLGLYEGINLQYALAPDDTELEYGNISYMQPFGHEGTMVTVGGGMSRTRPGFTLTPLDVQGLAKTVDLRVMQPFIRSRNENLSATLVYDYLDSTREDNTGAPTVNDRLSVVRAGSTFQIVDRFAGANTATAEISKGIGLFGTTGRSDLNTTRPGASDDFLKGTAELSRVQRVNDHFDIFASGTGQKASGRLLASEQFGVGGINYGSAYDSSEITGDDGMAARGELRLNNPFQTPLQSTQFYTFYDIGKVYDPGNTVPKDRMRSIASAGLGFRLALNKNFSGSFEYAKPLTRYVQANSDEHPRMFGTLTARF